MFSLISGCLRGSVVPADPARHRQGRGLLRGSEDLRLYVDLYNLLPKRQPPDSRVLAGLHDAQLGVDGGQRGHHPVGVRPRAALPGGGQIPGRPAVTGVRHVLVRLFRGVLRKRQPDRQPPSGSRPDRLELPPPRSEYTKPTKHASLTGTPNTMLPRGAGSFPAAIRTVEPGNPGRSQDSRTARASMLSGCRSPEDPDASLGPSRCTPSHWG